MNCAFGNFTVFRRCRVGHAIPARSSKENCRKFAPFSSKKKRLVSPRCRKKYCVVQATEQLEEQRDVADGKFTYTVDSLSSIADKLLDGQEAPNVEQIATGIDSSLRKGLTDSHDRKQERVRAFGTNRLPSRKEVSSKHAECRINEDQKQPPSHVTINTQASLGGKGYAGISWLHGDTKFGVIHGAERASSHRYSVARLPSSR